MQLSRIPQEQRRAIFRALVKAQDDGVPVARSRIQVASRFGLTRCQIERIEEEGLYHEWPPLSGPEEADGNSGENVPDEPILVAVTEGHAA